MGEHKHQLGAGQQVTAEPRRADLDFGDALRALEAGQRVARAGWNGKGMWVVLINPNGAMHTSAAGKFDMQPCFGLKTASPRGEMQPGWLPSQPDLLAKDWSVVED